MNCYKTVFASKICNQRAHPAGGGGAGVKNPASCLPLTHEFISSKNFEKTDCV